MKELQNHEMNDEEQFETRIDHINSISNNIGNKSFITHGSLKTRKKLTHRPRYYARKPSIIFHLSNFGSSKNRMHITKHVSMPEIIGGNRTKRKAKLRSKSCNAISWHKNVPYSTKYVVSEHRFKCKSYGFNIRNTTNFKVYRCQVAPGVAEDCHKCCCSCNSDVLFEVMKDLYDCYKHRDCDNCNCILCCNLPEHDRSELLKKTSTPMGLESALKELAMKGFPLPEGKTDSEKMLIDKIRYNLGLPPEPKTDAMRNKYTNAANAGLLLPLEKKTPAEKEKILKDLANMGIPLPEGRTPSEKSLIAKIKAGTGTPLTVLTPSEKMRKAKSAGLLTPFEGKSPDRIEKILRGLAMQGIPLPKGKTPSKKKLINKVRADLGLPPEPKTPAMVDKHNKAAKIGLLVPLEGKTPSKKEKILHGLHNMGIPLPVGRTPSEKALIAKIKAESKVPPITSADKIRASKSGGLRKLFDGKTPAQKEAILKDMAMKGVPLPEGKTDSDKNLINKIRHDLGLPPEPKTPSMKDRHTKAAEAGLLLPLEGKSLKEKERILRGLADMRIPLPKGRTPSEKALIGKVKLEAREPLVSPEKMRKAKAAGLLTPFEGKTPEQKEKIFRGLAMHGIPLPEGKTKSDKILLNKIRAELGLPPEPQTPSMKEKHTRAADAGQLWPLEGKSPKEKEKILQGYVDNGIPLPEGRTSSEKALIAKMKPKGRGVIECLCESLSPIVTIEKLSKAKTAGLLTPLEGKSPKEKEKILRHLAKMGLPLPTGRTPSDEALIKKIKKEFDLREDTPEEKIRKAKAAGFLSSLEDKTPEEKETILRGRVAAGLPLPEGSTPSEKDLINKIKASTGYVTPSPSERLRKAEAAGLITPLAGKTPSRKERILKDILAAGLPIPEGTTPSEKELIKKVTAPESPKAKKLKAAKAAGLLTPLAGKTSDLKEKILRGLAKMGLPLPKPNTPSERDLVDKVRFEMGLPPEPKSHFLRDKYVRAHDAGIIIPLEGKSLKDKEKILRRLQAAGIPLPLGRTRSEKALIKRVKAGILASPKTPFDEMTPEEKEKRLKHLIKSGRPLPDAKTPSGKALVDKVRKDLGLPPTPKTDSMKIKMKKAYDAGLITPLEGKNELQKRKILSRLAKAGIPLPVGRTPSEKALIRKILSKYRRRPAETSASLPSEMMMKAKELGLLTPLAGKTPEEKENILRGLAAQGMPLPEATTPSEKTLIDKIRKELGLPPEPTTSSMKEKHKMAAAAGTLVPLEGLSEPDKMKNLQALADMGIPLPEGRTPSEKDLIEMINVGTSPDMKMMEEEIAGLITPLTGKSPEEKERIVRGLAEAGLPLPKGKTRSEKDLIRKIKAELGIPPKGKTPSQKDFIRKAKARGLFTPLTGKKPAEKERIIRGLAEAGLPLPKGKTATERALIKRVKADLKAIETASDELLKSSKSTCERACGCGTKKIKFKHSYVKISIVSPDISNICPCPNDCLPGIKGGIYAGNKGINVVVERVIAIPEYPRGYSSSILEYNEMKPNELPDKSKAGLKNILNNNSNNRNYQNRDQNYNFKSNSNSDSFNCIIDTPHIDNSSKKNRNKRPYYLSKAYNDSYRKMPLNLSGIQGSQSNGFFDISRNYLIATDSACNSFDSIILIRTESSLSLDSLCEVIHTDSIISYAIGSSTSIATILSPTSNFDLSNDSINDLEFYTNGDDYCTENTIRRSSCHVIHKATLENNLRFNRTKQDDDYQDFQMSQRKLINLPEARSEDKLKTKSGQPVVVLNQLNSEIDVTAVVDEILSNKEFCNASSLFVLVPTSDDEDEPRKSDDTIDNPTCFHLSKNYNKWNCSDEEELSLPQRNTSKVISGLKVSAKGKKFFLEGVPISTIAPHGKETIFLHGFHRKIGDTDNKICQKASSDSIDGRSHIVSTDTTQDRPCCCDVEHSGSVKSVESHNDRCIMNVVSEVVIPLLNTQVIHSKTILQSKSAKKDTKQTVIRSPITSVSVCNIPPCVKVPRTCHFSDDVQYSDEDTSIDPLEDIKQLLEQQPPEKLKELYDQLRGDKKKICSQQPCPKPSKESICCGNKRQSAEVPGYSPGVYNPPTYLPQPRSNDIHCPKCGKPKFKDEYKGGKLIRIPVNCECGFDEICPTCFKPKYVEGKAVKCGCSGKTKTIKLRSLCPCEQHQWPMSKIVYGPKPGTVSVGCQCCMCDDNPIIGPHGQIIPRLGQTAPMIGGPPVSSGMQYGSGSIITPKGGAFRLRNRMHPGLPHPLPMGFYGQPNLESELGQLEVLGPAGGYVIKAPGGTYTQAGLRHTRMSTGAGTDMGNVGTESSTSTKKNCECSDRKGKRKGKVICECPPQPPEPKPLVPPPLIPPPLVPPEPGLEPGSQPNLPPTVQKKGDAWLDLEHIEPEPQNLHYLEYYDDYLRNKIENHKRKMQQMRSDLTQTTSGFKFNKKKRPRSDLESSDDSDVSVEDAIRYYALTNPELLKELLPQDLLVDTSHRTKLDCACEEAKAVNTELQQEEELYVDPRQQQELLELEKVVRGILEDRARRREDCECPEEPLTEEQKAAIEVAEANLAVRVGAARAAAAKRAALAKAKVEETPTPTPTPAAPEVPPEDEIPKGFKIRMPGKGSGSKGLTGICCFDMIEER